MSIWVRMRGDEGATGGGQAIPPAVESLEPRLLLNGDVIALDLSPLLAVESCGPAIQVDLDRQEEPMGERDPSILLDYFASSGQSDETLTSQDRDVESGETPVDSLCTVDDSELQRSSFSGATVDIELGVEIARDCGGLAVVFCEQSSCSVPFDQQDNIPGTEDLPIEARGPPIDSCDALSASSATICREEDQASSLASVECAYTGIDAIAPQLPGLQLVDAGIPNWQGQVIYLDFDGEQDVTYNGLVRVGPFDVPAFQAPGDLAGQEQAIIDQILLKLQDIFADSRVVFTPQQPPDRTRYSTIYVGGDDAAFASYGSFLGLAEQVDVGNRDRSDEGLVFSEQIAGLGGTEDFTTRLVGTIGHEVGHLLGMVHADAPGVPSNQEISLLEDVAGTIARWTGDSGNWSDPTHWDIGLVPNNGGGNTYDVIIDVADANPTITVDQNVTIDSLADAESVTISNGRSLTVKNGMELNGILALASTGSSTSIYFDGTQTLSGTGEVVFGGSSSLASCYVYARGGGTLATAATLTIGGNIVIHGSQSGSIRAWHSNYDTFINQGVISADTADKTITVSGANWTNAGLLKAENGGTLNLGGTFTTAGLGAFDSNGGTVNITGTLDNTGGTLALTDTTGPLTLVSGGTIESGVIATSGGAQSIAKGGTLDGVIVNGNVMVPNGGSPTVKNGMELNGVLTLASTGSSTSVYLNGTQTLSGAGEVVFGGSSSSVSDRVYARGGGSLATAATLTIGPDIVIHGPQSGNIQAYYGIYDSFIIQGTIDADTAGKTITVSGATWTNTGVLKAENGGTLNLGGTFTTAGLGAFDSNGGTVNITGMLDNTGAALVLTDTTGPLTLASSGTIRSGTIACSGAAQVVPKGGTLDGVTLNGDLTVASGVSLTVQNGLTLNGTLTLASTGSPAQLDFSGTQMLSGSGQVVFGGGGTSCFNHVYARRSGSLPVVLTVGPMITIHGSERGTIQAIYAEDIVVNQGTILADTAGKTITISGASWTNSGLLQAENGGTLNLGGTFTTAGLGAFDSNGGTVNITGTLDNTGAALVLSDAMGSLTLASSGTIKSGTITCNGAAQVVPKGGTLDGVTLNSDLTVANGASLTVQNGLTLNGTLTLTGTSTQTSVHFKGTQMLTGTGELVLGGDSHYENCVFAERESDGSPAVLTIGPGITIHGSGSGMLCGYYSNDSVICEASIEAENGAAISLHGLMRLDGVSRLCSQPASEVRINGNLLGDTRNADRYTALGTVFLTGSGTVSAPQLLEVMGQDRGTGSAGFARNFAYGTLKLATNAYVQLVDWSDNAPGSEGEAIYVNSLVVPASATLDLNGLHLYARIVQISGIIVGGTITQVPDGGPISLGTPTPGSITSAGEFDNWVFFGRGGRSVTVAVDTGVGSLPAPLPPCLNYAEIRLLDADDNILATANSAGSGQIVTVSDVLLPVDGSYRIQIQAAMDHSEATGDYVVSVWDVTPDVLPLMVDQQHLGNIENLYSKDHWTFSAAVGQAVCFDLLGSSTAGIVFDLTGPDGWVGFNALANDSDPVVLPVAGSYMLTARATGGHYGGSYVFCLRNLVATDISLGVPYVGAVIGSQQAQLFQFSMPLTQALLVSLTDTTAGEVNELYLKRGAAPTRSDYDYRATDPRLGSQQVLVSTAVVGTWYALVYTAAAPQPGTLSLLAEASDIFLTKVLPEYSGNGADTLLTLTAGGSCGQSAVELVAGDGATYCAARVTVTTVNQVAATFPAGSVPAGLYTVRMISPAGTIVELPNAFTMLEGGVAVLEANVIVPNALGWHAAATIYIEYANTGTIAMPAPLLTLTATQNGLQGALLTLDKSKANQGLTTDTLPSGYNTFVAIVASGATPGLLQPGESVTIPVYYGGWLHTQWDFSYPLIYFTAGSYTAEDSRPIDWTVFGPQILPEGMDETVSQAVLDRLETHIGTTWGDYVKALARDAARFALRGQGTNDASKLLAFEVEQAMCIPVGVITGRVLDATTGDQLAGVVVHDLSTGFRSAASATTDANGFFTLEGLYEGEHNLTLSGYLIDSNAPVTITATTDAIGVELRAMEAGHIVGCVTAAADGQPLASVLVQCTGQATGQTSEVLTVADGSYCLDTLPADLYTIVYSLAGYLTSNVAGIDLALGETLPVAEVTLVAGAALSGTVQQSSDGALLCHAIVLLQGQNVDYSATTTTGADGAWQLADLPADTYTLQCSFGSRTGQNTADVHVDPGESLGNIALMMDGVTLSGTISSSGTKVAIADADVVLYSDESVVSAGRTDASGHYELQCIAAGTYSLRVRATSYAPSWVVDIQIGGAALRVDVGLGAPANIVGSVTFNEEPASDVFVLATMQQDPGLGLSCATTGADGSFDVGDLAPGIYSLWFLDPADGADSCVEGVAVTAGQQLDLGTVAVVQSSTAGLQGTEYHRTDAESPPSGEGALAAGDTLGVRTSEYGSSGWSPPPVFAPPPGWTVPGHPTLPGNADSPVVQDFLRRLQMTVAEELLGVWITLGCGSELWSIFKSYLSSTPDNQTPIQRFSGKSSIIVAGFQNSELTNDRIQTIADQATGLLKARYSSTAELPSSRVELDIVSLLSDQIALHNLLYCPPRPEGYEGTDLWDWNVDPSRGIPMRIAGGSGSGDLVADGRWVTGTAVVSSREVSGGSLVTVKYKLILSVIDTFDFLPGAHDNLNPLVKMVVDQCRCLETYHEVYDVTYTVTCKMPEIEHGFYVPDPPEPDPDPDPIPPVPPTPPGPGPIPPIPPAHSQDPNDKLGPGGYAEAGYVSPSDRFAYRIDFENDPSATAPAQQVDIVDQLSADLDWNAFSLTEIAFGTTFISVSENSHYYATTVPMTYNGQTFDVQIEAGIDLTSGRVFAHFYSIDPNTHLPPDVLTGFLPPEDGTGRGQGQISYVIRPKADLCTGMEIRNIALIRFDLGEIIATNQIDPHDSSKGNDLAKECLNTIDAGAPTSQVDALPAQISETTFNVSWSGRDDADGTPGSGIASYDIYVSDNGAEYTVWLDDTEETSALFIGQHGHTYAFYSIATDNVGYVEDDPGVAEAQTTVTVSVLRVTQMQMFSWGFVAAFNSPIDASVLNLYDTTTAGYGPADVTVVGETVGSVAGSLIVSGDGMSVTFIKTSSPLEADTYTVTLRSASSGFQDTEGHLLDGDQDGLDGGDYMTAMTVASATSRLVSVPDFARGPGQDVDVPATGSGIPIRISDGTGVQAAEFVLRYDPDLMTVTSVSLGTGLPADWSLSYDLSTEGQVLVAVQGVTALSAGVQTLVVVEASVPDDAPYSTAGLLELSDVEINGGAIESRADSGIEVVAYLGDATGNHAYSGLDASYIARVSVGLDSGFAKYRMKDPVLIGDVTGNGKLSGLDASYVARKVVGLAQPQIPDLPGVLPPIVAGGVDPLLSIGCNTTAEAGETITLEILVDDATDVLAADIVLGYDTAVFDLNAGGLSKGALTSGWTLVGNVDDATGHVRMTLYGIDPLSGGSGSLAKILAVVREDAPAGVATLDLAEASALNEGELVLTLQDDQIEILAEDEPATMINDRVSIAQGSMLFDRRTGLASVELTIRNTSAVAITGPIRLAIGWISDPGVSVAAADGMTKSGLPYIDLSNRLGDGVFSPGEVVKVRVSFSNPLRRRFAFRLFVFATV